MILPCRHPENPILQPESKNFWEQEGAFNGCPIEHKDKIYLLYRAISPTIHHENVDLELSTIARAESDDGYKFNNKKQFIIPEHHWEKYGCEDPRVVKLGDKFYIFYTALGGHPFGADNIKVAVAITRDMDNIERKKLVTPFNAKAMCLFPEKINDKMWAVLSADTDQPPSKICVACFEKERDIWNKDFWDDWRSKVNQFILPLQRRPVDQVELGAPPVKTSAGWLLIFSYIKNYFGNDPASFGVEAVLLDSKDPTKIIGKCKTNMLSVEEEYEIHGAVPNIVFPSGALADKDDNKLDLYYGAADYSCCVAHYELDKVIKNIKAPHRSPVRIRRVPGNPIIEPKEEHPWEALATFNPAAIRLDGDIYIVYRAMSEDNTSVMGCAVSKDGINISERMTRPIYEPRTDHEAKKVPRGNSGCEDPRLTLLDDRVYMLYTAFNGEEPPQVALTYIKKKDFLARNWNWQNPILISPQGVDDKDACLLEKKINGKYVVFHRLGNNIDIVALDNLDFTDRNILHDTNVLKPRKGRWDGEKLGIAGPPVKTDKGWLLLYHGVSEKDNIYRVGAALLDLENPVKVIGRLDYPIFEPEAEYEKEGIVPNVVFPCGSVVMDGNLYIYYGGADKVTGVGVVEIDKILEELT